MDELTDNQQMDLDADEKKPAQSRPSGRAQTGSNEKSRRVSLGATSDRDEDEMRKRLVEAAGDALRQLPEYEHGERFLVKLREVLEGVPGVYVAE